MGDNHWADEWLGDGMFAFENPNAPQIVRFDLDDRSRMWVRDLVFYMKQKGLFLDGNIIIFPDNIVTTVEFEDYAKRHGIEIKRASKLMGELTHRLDDDYTLTAGYMEPGKTIKYTLTLFQRIGLFFKKIFNCGGELCDFLIGVDQLKKNSVKTKNK